MTLFWVLVLPLWAWVSPIYGRLLSFVADPIFRTNPFNDYEISYRFEKISIISHIVFSVTQISDGKKVYIEGSPSWDSRRFHFSFTVWVALLLATPFDGKWGKKILCFFIGWLIIFASQLLSLFFQTLHHNMLFLETLIPMQKYQPPTSMDYLLAWIGRYSLLIGNIVFPLIVWLFVGVPRLRSSAAPAIQSESPTATPSSTR